MADQIQPGRDLGGRRGSGDQELEDALREMGQRLFVPPTPDLARTVRLRLKDGPTRRTPAAWRSWLNAAFGSGPGRAIATAVLILAVTGAALLTLAPSAREAVAGWFDIQGIRIVFVEETPTPAALGGNLLLGERVVLADAADRAGFPIRLPDPARFGQPEEVYFREREDGAMVTLLYYPRPGLPATAETGVGLLFVQFEAADGAFWMEKGANPANDVRAVDVHDERALWIEGAHYLLIDPDPAFAGVDRFPAPQGRTAGSVLLWDDGGVTFRLESALTMDGAIAVAESVAARSAPVASPDADR